jgi:hypothetical protein
MNPLRHIIDTTAKAQFGWADLVVPFRSGLAS